MAVTAFLKLKGQKQGDINGSVTQAGRQNSILVHSYNHEIVTAIVPSTGALQGRRIHRPLILVKDIDRSTPLLRSALATNEVLTVFQLGFVEPGAAGTVREFFTIALTNARVASIKATMADNQDPAVANLSLREEVAFVYEKIQWTWVDGGITSQDDFSGAAA